MQSKYLEMYMKVAEVAAEASVADRLQVGCCIVTPSGMCSIGLNGTYPGFHTNVCEEVLPDGKSITKLQVRHAEFAALSKMMAEGVSTKGSTVFITHSPCHPCAMLLIGAQVKQVFYRHKYRCREGIKELTRAGIRVLPLL